MSITVHDRKLLWARAGGVCALCKSRLTADAKPGDRDVVLGEEAHIVSEKPNGPRFRPMPIHEVDAYANLLFLCPSDHKIVDEQVTYYTEQHLHALKREHEQWVQDRVSPGISIPVIKIRDPEADKPVILQRIDTGRALMNLLKHIAAAHYDNPEPQSSEEAELIGEFFQATSDYADIWDDIGPGERIQTEFSLSEDIARLREAGLVVYAGAKKHVIEGGIQAPAPWRVTYIVIYRGDDESIQASLEDK
jgi:hypothetical protein